MVALRFRIRGEPPSGLAPAKILGGPNGETEGVGYGKSDSRDRAPLCKQNRGKSQNIRAAGSARNEARPVLGFRQRPTPTAIAALDPVCVQLNFDVGFAFSLSIRRQVTSGSGFKKGKNILVQKDGIK